MSVFNIEIGQYKDLLVAYRIEPSVMTIRAFPHKFNEDSSLVKLAQIPDAMTDANFNDFLINSYQNLPKHCGSLNPQVVQLLQDLPSFKFSPESLKDVGAFYTIASEVTLKFKRNSRSVQAHFKLKYGEETGATFLTLDTPLKCDAHQLKLSLNITDFSHLVKSNNPLYIMECNGEKWVASKAISLEVTTITAIKSKNK